MANAVRCLRAAPPNAAHGSTVKIGDEHELLGLSFPRRFRHSRQHSSHIAAATSAASAFTSAAAASASDTARAAASDTTRTASSDTARAASGNPASAAACKTAGAATRDAAV